MARIPTPVTQGAQQLGGVQQRRDPGTPFQNLRAPDLTGPGRSLQQTGQAIGQAGARLAEIAQQRQTLEDERNLLEIQHAYGEWQRSRLYGENGLFTRENGNAVGVTEEFDQSFAAFLQEQNVSQRSLSDNGKIAADRWLQSRRSSLLETASRHEMEQTKNYNNQLQEAYIEDMVDEGSYFYNDPEKFGLAEGQIRQQALAMAKRQGYSPEQTEEFVESKVAGLYTAAIERALNNGQPRLAENYLSQARDSEMLSGEALAKYEGMVRERATREAAFQTTEEIMNMGMDEQSALAYARSNITDPDERRLAVEEIKTRFAEDRRFEEQRLKELKTEAVELARRGEFDKISPAALADMGGAMADTLRRLSARARRGGADVSDPQLINELNQMSNEDLAKVDFLQDDGKWLEGLTPGDWDKWSDRQGTINRSGTDPEASRSRQQLRTRTQIFRSTVSSLNLNDAEADLLDRAIDDYLFSLTPEQRVDADIQAVVDRLIVQGEVQKSGWDPTKRVFELTPEERELFYVDDVDNVPPSERADIVRAAQARGLQVTDNLILTAYAKRLKSRGLGTKQDIVK